MSLKRRVGSGRRKEEQGGGRGTGANFNPTIDNKPRCSLILHGLTSFQPDIGGSLYYLGHFSLFFPSFFLSRSLSFYLPPPLQIKKTKMDKFLLLYSGV